MSLFGALMGDMDDDIMGPHLNMMNMQMRNMNRMMNSLIQPDPFNMFSPFDNGFQQNQLMERGNNQHQAMMGGGLFGFPMSNINRLLSADIGAPSGASYCSSSVVTMSSGPDGRPQIYQATSTSKTGPGGIRETRKTVQDSRSGLKKMAIGHHIGDRAHIIEKEQNLNSGQLEERQEFINLDEEEAENFDREFTTRARHAPGGGIIHQRPSQLTIEPVEDDEDDVEGEHVVGEQILNGSGSGRRQLPAIAASQQQLQQQQQQQQQKSIHPHPYNAAAGRRHRPKHTQQHQQSTSAAAAAASLESCLSATPATTAAATAAVGTADASVRSAAKSHKSGSHRSSKSKSNSNHSDDN